MRETTTVLDKMVHTRKYKKKLLYRFWLKIFLESYIDKWVMCCGFKQKKYLH